MEKITSEELIEMENLSPEDQEKIAGGSHPDKECMQKCMKGFKDLYKCMKICIVD